MRAAHLSSYQNRMQKAGKPFDKPIPEIGKENQPYTQGKRHDDISSKNLAVVREPRCTKSELDKSSQWSKSILSDISNQESSRKVPALRGDSSHYTGEGQRMRVDHAKGHPRQVLGPSHNEVNKEGPFPIPQQVCPSSSPVFQRVPIRVDGPIIEQTLKESRKLNLMVSHSLSFHKRKANEPILLEKRQKVPHAASVGVEFAHMQHNQHSRYPNSSDHVVRSMEHSIKREEVVITEERVDIVCRRFIHVK